MYLMKAACWHDVRSFRNAGSSGPPNVEYLLYCSCWGGPMARTSGMSPLANNTRSVAQKHNRHRNLLSARRLRWWPGSPLRHTSHTTHTIWNVIYVAMKRAVTMVDERCLECCVKVLRFRLIKKEKLPLLTVGRYGYCVTSPQQRQKRHCMEYTCPKFCMLTLPLIYVGLERQRVRGINCMSNV